MEYADQACKQLRNVTLKPIQPCSSVVQHQHRIGVRSRQEKHASSCSPISFPSLPPTFTFLSDYSSPTIALQQDCLKRTDETLEERATRILAPIIKNQQTVAPRSTHQLSNLDRKQLIDSIQSCLNTMHMALMAADELCQFYRRGLDCRAKLNYLIKAHSAAFYLKVSTSVQIKDALKARLKLSQSEVADIINAIKMDICHEQSFVAELASTTHILTKLDNTASIVPNSSNRMEKRSITDDVNIENKKIKVETPELAPNMSLSAATNIAPKFVNASTMAQAIPDITDEELLEFTLEFERKHGI
ncbi:unnamed protein product [Adineta steineri]|uniref:Uncharacterized protein n=1 Tax=Adineta steineri TaxID=433720 RepID=A0A819Q7T3_9BILA|nr:unnamed protein product [Adineta steineri]CAF4024136.1 unnamed protein product [Adineta steineri]